MNSSSPLKTVSIFLEIQLNDCCEGEILKEIEIPGINYIKFISFSPFETSTIFIASAQLLLKTSIQGNLYDTLLFVTDNIVNLTVEDSGKIFLATENALYCSTNQGSAWDTIYNTSGANPTFSACPKMLIFESIFRRKLLIFILLLI